MREAEAYSRHMNLKLAAHELGMKWQTLYYRLKRAGVPVVGDKLRHGSDRDRLAARAERMFAELVPEASPLNAQRFQAKFDFDVNGHKVDVKAAIAGVKQKRSPGSLAWSFSFKRQSLVCDFIVCFCMESCESIVRVLLVPSEFFTGIQTVTVPVMGRSKWHEFTVEPHELRQFFAGMGRK